MEQTIKSLQEDFPDMSQSVIGDVLKEYKGDKHKAAAALGGIESQTKDECDKKIKELLQLFPTVSDKDCEEVLKGVNWDVDAAIAPMFNKVEELKQRARKDKEVELKKKREVEAKKQSENLMDVFHTLPKEEIQRLLDENEGDVEETTEQLLVLVAQQDNEKIKREATKKEEEKRMKEEQEMRLKELKLQALEDKFEDLSERDVIGGLEAVGWDIKKAHLNLMKLSADKKKKYLKSLFTSLKEEQIEAALEANDWDKVKASHFLQEQLREKKQGPVVVKKVATNNLLERSMVLGKQMEDEITASHVEFERALKAETLATFRKDLEHIVHVQARNGVSPGMAPPLVKEIDEMLGKNRKSAPIADSELPVVETVNPPQVRPVENESKMDDKPQDGSKYAVTLKASENVDIGNTITVEWEMTLGESTPNDWIGFYPIDQPNKNYITYQWRGKSDSNKGTVTFVAPNYYGKFECRYFVSKSYTHVAMSNQIVVGPKIELSAKIDSTINKIIVKWSQQSGNKYPRAWIGLFERSQTNHKLFITWEYANFPEISFVTPVKPKEYEFRFFTNSYEPVAVSNPILIEGEDKIIASWENGMVTVVPNIVSVDPAVDAVWVGVFFVSEKDHRQWRRYKYLHNRTTQVQFKAPRHGGEYEVRLFSKKTYDLMVKSAPFNIPHTM